MHKLVSKLLIYSNLEKDSILSNLCVIFKSWEKGEGEKEEIIARIYKEIKKILDISTAYGFDTNLWHNYLTFLFVSNENSFSLTCERTGASEDGTVNYLAKQDFRIFKALFDFDFGPIERDLGIDCFTTICSYKAVAKRERVYNRNVSEKVQELSLKIAAAEGEEEIFRLVTDHYKRYGVGLFGVNRAFRIRRGGTGGRLDFVPINNADSIRLDDLVGYKIQKEQLVTNTRAFVEGKAANNVLLYGDSGTGKSTSVRAVLNEYYDKGLRMIEIYKHQFRDLSDVIAQIKDRNYFFIIFIDDLSFEEHEVEYKFLKAVIEGGVESRPDNILIYATSNRRHLIKETWNDRNDMEFNGEIHRSDTVEEKLSLSARFGVLINYSIPNRQEYHEIVEALAAKQGIKMERDKLLLAANTWELRHGGVSGRTAQQFINYLEGEQDTNG